MKLQELAKNKTQQVSKVMEGHFNAKIDVTKLNLEQAKTLLAKTSSIIAEVQSSTQRHTSQQNPTYLGFLHISATALAATACLGCGCRSLVFATALL